MVSILLAGYAQFLGACGLVLVVGRDNGFVQIDSAGNPAAAAVCQIPSDRIGFIHVGESFARVSPYFHAHEVVDTYRYIYQRFGAIVPQIEVGRCAGGVLVGI